MRMVGYAQAASRAIGAGEYGRAAEVLSETIEVCPRVAILHALRGEAYYYLGKHDEAVADCTQAVALGVDKEKRSEMFYFRAAAYHALKRYGESEVEIEQAIALNPKRADFFHTLGDARYGLGRREAAIEAHSRALELNPEYFSSLLARATCYREMERYSEAVADLTALLKFVPDRGVPLGLRGMVYYKLGDTEHGIADITRALELWPQHDAKPAGYYHVRAKMYQQEGRLSEALADLDTVLAIKPEEMIIHTDRADILRAMGRVDEAEKALEGHHRLVIRRIQEVQQRGVKVTAALIMANMVLYDPESQENSVCRVLITFDPELGRHHQRLRELAQWLGSFKSSHQTEPEMQYLAELTTVEAANFSRRRLPTTKTGGAIVDVTDLWVYRRFWPVLNADLLPCVAEPGDVGRQELLPPEQA